MKRFLILAFGFVLMTAATPVTAQQVRYHVKIDEATPTIAKVTMTLPTRRDGRALYSRAGDNQTKTQVANVNCAGKTIEPDARGRWRLPGACRTINWDVNLIVEGDEGIAGFDQKSVLMKSRRWWVFASPSALLRLTREPRSLKITFDVPHQEPFDARLPSASRPPAYFALGDYKQESVRRNGVILNYISDDPEYTSQFVKPDDHAAALSYMSKVLGVSQAGSTQEITMIMMGIIRDRGVLGGAAGSNAMIVNYIYENEKSREMERYLPILVALHEQFHQLYSGTSHPVWVTESLAHYYATKAILKIYPDNKVVEGIVNELYQADRGDVPGLLEINRQVDEERKFDHYNQFYSLGSAYWKKIDDLIASGSGGSNSLDDYLADIMRMTFRKGVGIPLRFRDQIRYVGDDDLEKIEADYLF
ncbi:hypothetical protein [Pseudemcibacter aquimaris]|uniref:hypothetical protein n=1 Tax=Pseudemcibacter aquimaris TaxID=2857064 RepID=UPI00201350DB|nr:hypothetical protein [Pseudemcibacter aquimaris]MCC3859890.1 hypothetical protein [Pseudemcibacter aquimaris]WDU57222.1 hypothetical protein KW060_08430 [Pseudemcibacter aquimaris]